MKGSALARSGVHPDAAAVVRNDALTDGEADPGTRYFTPVQAFEYAENALVMLRRDTLAVVIHSDRPTPCLRLRGHADPRTLGAPILDSVGDEVLKKLDQLRVANAYGRERFVNDFGFSGLDGGT